MLLKAEIQTFGSIKGVSAEAKNCCRCCLEADKEAWISWIVGCKILVNVVVQCGYCACSI